MQRKRGLVPIGGALSGLDVPVQALRETSRPARRGFTHFDQVEQLIVASEASCGPLTNERKRAEEYA